jgi:hypothetical protein
MLTKEFLYNAMRQYRLAVISTSPGGGSPQPESALVGIGISPDLEIVFDTTRNSRKYHHLLANPRVAWVIGWDDETTIQYEGFARELTPGRDDHYREIYYSAYPDGRERLISMAQLTHFVVTPRWIRYSNFNPPVRIEELRLHN